MNENIEKLKKLKQKLQIINKSLPSGKKETIAIIATISNSNIIYSLHNINDLDIKKLTSVGAAIITNGLLIILINDYEKKYQEKNKVKSLKNQIKSSQNKN